MMQYKWHNSLLHKYYDRGPTFIHHYAVNYYGVSSTLIWYPKNNETGKIILRDKKIAVGHGSWFYIMECDHMGEYLKKIQCSYLRLNQANSGHWTVYFEFNS
jgi:hypothetical protein